MQWRSSAPPFVREEAATQTGLISLCLPLVVAAAAVSVVSFAPRLEPWILVPRGPTSSSQDRGVYRCCFETRRNLTHVPNQASSMQQVPTGGGVVVVEEENEGKWIPWPTGAVDVAVVGEELCYFVPAPGY